MNVLAETTNQTIDNTTNVFQRMAHSLFNGHSILVFVTSLAVALLLGRLIAHLMRGLVLIISRQADRSPIPRPSIVCGVGRRGSSSASLSSGRC